MREEFGDLWDLAADADAICITTNGTITLSGRGVMGKGVALQAKQRYANIEARLGVLLQRNGNIVQYLNESDEFPSQFWSSVPLLTFPVKHQWHYKADLELIHRSACQLMGVIAAQGYQRVLLPRPGCGNGGLFWEEVKPIIEPVLDDRVVVIDRR